MQLLLFNIKRIAPFLKRQFNYLYNTKYLKKTNFVESYSQIFSHPVWRFRLNFIENILISCIIELVLTDQNHFCSLIYKTRFIFFQ